MTLFQLEITTPEKIVFQQQVTSVTLPTVDGQITVLANHLPLVTVLRPGELIIRQNDQPTPFAVAGGFIEVEGNKLVVLADSAERFDEIDEARAEQARQRAEELKQKTSTDDVQFARIAASLDRELARLHVVRKYRHRGHVGITQEGVRHEDAGQSADQE